MKRCAGVQQDMQDDKERFLTRWTRRRCALKSCPMLKSATFHKDAMRAAAAKGFLKRHRLAPTT
jgi:argininosuccinate lyase